MSAQALGAPSVNQHKLWSAHYATVHKGGTRRLSAEGREDGNPIQKLFEVSHSLLIEKAKQEGSAESLLWQLPPGSAAGAVFLG